MSESGALEVVLVVEGPTDERRVQAIVARSCERTAGTAVSAPVRFVTVEGHPGYTAVKSIPALAREWGLGPYQGDFGGRGDGSLLKRLFFILRKLKRDIGPDRAVIWGRDTDGDLARREDARAVQEARQCIPGAARLLLAVAHECGEAWLLVGLDPPPPQAGRGGHRRTGGAPRGPIDEGHRTEGALMVEVLLFHHVLGVTPGLRAIADALRAAGHRVVVPDLFDGRTFDTIEAGVAHAQALGFEAIAERGAACADGMRDRLVVIGFSLGVLPAQKIAQNRPGVAGAILCHSAVAPSVFGDHWPAAVALQLHFAEADPWAAEDLPVARALAEEGAELCLYPGSAHLIADASSADFDPILAAQLVQKMLEFLARC